MKVKVCGLTQPKNIEEVLSTSPDMVGFIFHKNSPRMVDEEKLPKWIEEHEDTFGEIKRVGIFVDAKIAYLLNAVHDFKLDYVQLHGTESPEYCREIQDYWNFSSIRKAKFIKAFPVDEDFDFSTTLAYENLCAYFLFDTKTSKPGGSGKKFNWKILKKYMGLSPFLLSGGIAPEDAAVIKKMNFPQMAGIDINSQFEKKPGVKDVKLVSTFMKDLGR